MLKYFIQSKSILLLVYLLLVDLIIQLFEKPDSVFQLIK